MTRTHGTRARKAPAFAARFGTLPTSWLRTVPQAITLLGAEQPLTTSELLGHGRDPTALIKDAVIFVIETPARWKVLQAGTVTLMTPGRDRPAISVTYSQETMHGVECAFGRQFMMIGETEKGIEVFAAVRDRYRGHNCYPWNLIECGSNYSRSMASYAALLVL